MNSTWSSSLSAALVLALCLGCKSDPTPRNCGDQEPTYLVTIIAATGTLPDDTTIEVSYGGDNSESFSLADAGKAHEVLFCHPADGDPDGSAGGGGQGGASPASGGPAALVCELWIEGGAAIEVTGGDLDSRELSLSPESDDCGPLTVEEEIVLGEEATED